MSLWVDPQEQIDKSGPGHCVQLLQLAISVVTMSLLRTDASSQLLFLFGPGPLICNHYGQNMGTTRRALIGNNKRKTWFSRAIACVGSASKVVRIPDLESQVERSRASLVELGPRVDGVNQLMGLMPVTLRSCCP